MTTPHDVPMPEPSCYYEGIPTAPLYEHKKLIAYADARCAALREEVNAARRTADYWKANSNGANAEIEDLKSERDALAEKVKALQDDARRYRWLRGRMFVRRNAAVPDRYGLDEYLLSEGIDEQDDADFIDAAIDAATEET